MASKDPAQGGKALGAKARAGDARGDDPHAGERSELLRQVEQEVAETAHWLGKDRLAPEVMAAIARVPRHAFVPPMEAASARSAEHTSEPQSLTRSSYAVFCL